MEKEAFLKIIIQDIRELDLLLNAFSGKDEIPEAFIKLAKSKAQGIINEIDLLGSIKSSPSTPEEFQPAIKTNDEDADLKNETTSSKTKAISTHKESVPTKDVLEKTTESLQYNQSEKEEIKSKDVTAPTPTSAPQKSIPNNDPESRQNTVIGETLGKDKQSFNELLARDRDQEDHQLSTLYQPIKDLKKAIGINDRFFFQRELFGGNADLFNQTLDQLNEMESFEAAKTFLLSNFNWDQKNEAVVGFNKLIKRRYL